MIDDEKLRLLAFEDRWHFIALLCLKGQGVIDEGGNLLMRKAAVKMGIDVRTLEEVARRLAEVGLIDKDTLQPLAWEQRQFQSDNSTERVRRFREKKIQEKQQPNSCNTDETLQKRFCNVIDTDTEADTESENLNVPNGTFVIGVADDAVVFDQACEPKNPASPTITSPGLAKAITPQANGDPPESIPFALQATEGAETVPRIDLPPCPHQRIIALYAERLPTLPQPRVWEGTRERNLSARWRWVLTARKPSGGRYAETTEEAVAFFDRFFAYVARSDFLSGRNGKWGGCSLAWLIKADNFAKVIEGAYENREAA
jgi:hypothetical protein